MIKNWLEEYKRLSEKTVFLSKFGSFIIAIFTLLSLYDFARFFYIEPNFWNSFTETEKAEFWVSIVFQLSIFIFFTLRFTLLFFKTSKIFWLTQGLSFVGFILLASYWFVSRPPIDYYKFFPHEWVVFSYASRSLELYGLYYLLLSPVRRFITLIISLLKFEKNKK
jgi:hypothetical protein